MFIISGFRYIDGAYNRLDLMECIQRLQDIEDTLQDPKLYSLGELSIDLNTLNRKVCELRTCVQYIKASMDSILATTGAFNSSQEQYRDSMQALNSDTILLQKVSEQRLLDVESVQQRMDMSLSVVSLYVHLPIARVV